MTPTQRRAAALAIATALAIPAEGLRQWAYQDPPGIWTICYGTTAGVKRGDYKTLEQCRGLLDRDMNGAIDDVLRCTAGIPLSDKTLGALGDMVYNLGPTPVCNTAASTLARKLKAGDIEGACDQIPRWDKARVAGVMVTLPGLTKRRGKEQALCLEGLA